MEVYTVEDKESCKDFIDLILEDKPEYKITQTGLNYKAVIHSGEYKDTTFKIKKNQYNAIKSALEPTSKPKFNPLIFGKDQTGGIVSVEIVNGEVWMYLVDGSIKRIENIYWILAPQQYDKEFMLLDGNLHYKYIRTFKTKSEMQKFTKLYKYKDIYQIWDEKEACMVWNGITLFKGLKVNDVSVLSFDIETSGIARNKGSRVFLITNKFRDRNGKIIKKVFSTGDNVEDDVQMIKDWCKWVQEIDPDILTGHNIYGFDLDYMNHVSRVFGDYQMELGRDCSPIKFNSRASKYRVDGSQEWDYKKAFIHGRQIIDGMFLAVKYDFSRKYPSWGLKPIIDFEYKSVLKKKKKDLTKEEKLFIERQKDRTFYNAADIGKNWNNLEERKKIVEYAIDDADDSLYLYDLMINSYFYYTQSIPKTFQNIINSGTGGQINSFLVRSYLQDRHSIPKKSERRSYGGGISMGVPGIHKHVNKVDVASLYPSIMITESVYDKDKDPKQNFLKMVTYFTEERLNNKKLAKDTGDRYFKDVEQSQKIVINSAYGLLGTNGLNFNSFDWADFVTKTGRDILLTGVQWATGHTLEQIPKLLKSGKPELNPVSGKPKLEWVIGNKIGKGMGYKLVNVDTDSFSYTTGKKLTDEEFKEDIKEINKLYKDGIIWEDDGRYKVVVVVKAKNYALIDYTNKSSPTIKGSALKASMKENALKEMNKELLNHYLTGNKDLTFEIYNKYCSEVLQKDLDISRWASKKTVTKAVLNPERTTEQKIYDIIEGKNYQEGDKIRVYFTLPNEDGEELLKLEENFNGDHSRITLLNKIYKTLEVFEKVIDISLIPDYNLKRNNFMLEKL